MPNIREKLIELITAFYGVDPGYYGVDAPILADHLIANGVTVQQWISVKDRLPELHTKVLCCGPKGGVFIAETRTCAGRVLWDDRTRIGKRNVTHWMPLPESAKENDYA